MGGKKKRGGGGKAKAAPRDDSDMMNPPESRDDYVEEFEQLEVTDKPQVDPLPVVRPPTPPVETTDPQPASDEVCINIANKRIVRVHLIAKYIFYTLS